MRTLGSIASLSLFSVFLSIASPVDARADAEQFKALHCNKCHEISALKIEADKKSGGDDEDEGGGDDAPDLSHVGKYHDAAYLKSFLLKETAHVAHADNDHTKKHPKKFKGTDEELAKMVDWLVTLK